jgi:hypothetical protein
MVDVACPKAYAQDIEKLFNIEKFSDVKIVCGHETFFCHKNILATRCYVFAAMFDSMTDPKGVVQADYIDAEIMKIILAYIYGNKIDDEIEVHSKFFWNNMNKANRKYYEAARRPGCIIVCNVRSKTQRAMPKI